MGFDGQDAVVVQSCFPLRGRGAGRDRARGAAGTIGISERNRAVI